MGFHCRSFGGLSYLVYSLNIIDVTKSTKRIFDVTNIDGIPLKQCFHAMMIF